MTRHRETFWQEDSGQVVNVCYERGVLRPLKGRCVMFSSRSLFSALGQRGALLAPPPLHVRFIRILHRPAEARRETLHSKGETSGVGSAAELDQQLHNQKGSLLLGGNIPGR